MRLPAPLTLYRDGQRDPITRAAHADRMRDWLHDIAETELDPDTRAELLDLVRAAGEVAGPAAQLGLTHQRVYGLAAWNDAFATDLDAALSARCAGGQVCGRPAGYRRRGRCPACRAAHTAGNRRARDTQRQ